MIRRSILLCCICLAGKFAKSQQLEPRAYAALPKNLNSIAVAYSLARGNVLTDPTLPVKDLSITTNTIAANYMHTFGVVKKLARIQVTIPCIIVSGKAQINGNDTSAQRGGLGDALVKIGINLTGSPPLAKKDFVKYTQETIVGVSLVASIPTGIYYEEKRLNIGNHRWGFKPEVGISKRFGRLYTEAYTGVWLYTSNNDYLKTKKLEQEPVFNFQVHASYFFKNKMMVSANTVWFKGGETLIDNVSQGNLLNNWRVGATWSLPVGRRQSLKLQLHTGAFTARGYDYNSASLVYMLLF